VRPPPTLQLGTVQRRPSVGVGGFIFAVDPQLSADRTPVSWRPEALPTVIQLAATRFPGARPLDIEALGDVVAQRNGSDGRHLIVRIGGRDLRLWLVDPFDQPLAVVLPFDEDLPVRTAAALQLWARAFERTAEQAEPQALTGQRRDRLALMVRALDGHLADAPYREIAEVLFGVRRLESEAWRTSSLRDRTIRLVRDGIALMRAGYRKLLRGR
jgi:hypothetical protein